ncbi:patatin-like phospholipase [Phyllobacterium bourgognense]|uniref:Patatin-like phospholipase n=2 Tax=Phyllobacterium bourgognense TaxID=314236 RepID=A0A368YNM9_9HYPH|nr:patatin-like phospholipase [Phyllobacterium bourgognense]
MTGQPKVKPHGKPFRILTLDGGGSKGIYTVGVLNELEAHLSNGPLANSFDLIYGTSTGAIIAALVALGETADEITRLYFEIIPCVMRSNTASERTLSLQKHSERIFGERKFDSFRTKVGIVSTNYHFSRPTIFKSHAAQAFSMQKSFKPGFGCTISEAVLASTAALPFFLKRDVLLENQGPTALIDGGFVANNPTLYAITDAVGALKVPVEHLHILSIGVGQYVQADPKMSWFERKKLNFLKKNFPVDILEKTLDASAMSTEILVRFIFENLKYVRINDSYIDNGFATNLLEHDREKLQRMYQLGRTSFGRQQSAIEILLDAH